MGQVGKYFSSSPRLASGLTVGTGEECWAGDFGEQSRPESSDRGGQGTLEERTGPLGGVPKTVEIGREW